MINLGSSGPPLTQEPNSLFLGCISSFIGSHLTHERPTSLGLQQRDALLCPERGETELKSNPGFPNPLPV